jgi:hypothetical protein
VLDRVEAQNLYMILQTALLQQALRLMGPLIHRAPGKP